MQNKQTPNFKCIRTQYSDSNSHLPEIQSGAFHREDLHRREQLWVGGGVRLPGQLEAMQQRAVPLAHLHHRLGRVHGQPPGGGARRRRVGAPRGMVHRVRATPAGTRANDAAILLDITTER